MITSWDLYWITRLDQIEFFLCLIFFVGALVLIVIAAMSAADNDERPKWALKWMYILLAIGLITIFIPNTKTMVAILFVPKIVNNETVQQIPENAAKFIDMKLKEWISDLNKSEKEKSK